jgi:hypothetical protein
MKVNFCIIAVNQNGDGKGFEKKSNNFEFRVKCSHTISYDEAEDFPSQIIVCKRL